MANNLGNQVFNEFSFTYLGIVADNLHLLLVDDCHCYPADANQLIFFVCDFNFPYVRLPAYMHWLYFSRDKAITNTLDVIGVDVKANAILQVSIEATHGSNTSQGFCQSN